MKTVLLVDIGNTRASLCHARGMRLGAMRHLPTRRSGRADIAACLAALPPFADAIVSSVVPEVNAAWLATLARRCGRTPLLLTHDIRLQVGIRYPAPETIGADRLANACGALVRYGAPVIVADFGTALTFDVVARDGAYVGGVIAPGTPFVTRYLAEKTALLPEISLGPHRIERIGRSTVGAMRIGAAIGYRGMVREIIHWLRVAPGMRQATLCATGGDAAWALQGIGMPIHLDPKLTMRGLAAIYRLNRG